MTTFAWIMVGYGLAGLVLFAGLVGLCYGRAKNKQGRRPTLRELWITVEDTCWRWGMYLLDFVSVEEE